MAHVFNLDMIKAVYDRYPARIAAARKVLGRPMTLTEKILYSHLAEGEATKEYIRGKDYVNFAPDRVAMQDATAQMAVLQFMTTGREEVAVPTTIHCDHLIKYHVGAAADLEKAKQKGGEVFKFLQSASNKYGIGYWEPGAGIIHQVMLENYVFPGVMLIGTDSHTPNGGGLGGLAIGVGGADASEVMSGLPWELKQPKLIGVHLKGKLNGWASAKDIISVVVGILTVKGGTGAIVEYFGEGAKNISATGKGTICNMGAEHGATTSTFGYDDSMRRYLKATGREVVVEMADRIAEHLNGDPEVYAEPEKYFDRVIEIDLDTLEPHVNGPYTPDLSRPISKLAQDVKENGWPDELEVALIGSCTNSSYEDLTRSADVARQALAKGLKAVSEFTVTPGSEQIRFTAERDGLLDTFKEMGGVMLANACGPCIGQWGRVMDDPDRKNSIMTSYNRNFAKRNDGNTSTHAFMASPELVTAMSLAGTLSFNPMTDTLVNDKGERVKLDPPKGIELPPKGFDVEDNGYFAPAEDGSTVEVKVAPDSERIQLLSPFPAWDGKNITDAVLLIKAKGKCTTDHISMAGPWLRFRGHLDNISNNTLTGAINFFNDMPNKVKNQLTGEYGEVPTTQRAYKAAKQGSVVVADHNYGEGSSREHAAMQPRHLGVSAVIAKSFARIHESNLKKQGLLGVTFDKEEDYDKVQEDDRFNFIDLDRFAPGKQITVELVHKDGSKDTIKCNHSYNEQQIEWYKAGSALNKLRQDLKAG